MKLYLFLWTKFPPVFSASKIKNGKIRRCIHLANSCLATCTEARIVLPVPFPRLFSERPHYLERYAPLIPSIDLHAASEGVRVLQGDGVCVATGIFCFVVRLYDWGLCKTTCIHLFYNLLISQTFSRRDAIYSAFSSHLIKYTMMKNCTKIIDRHMSACRQQLQSQEKCPFLPQCVALMTQIVLFTLRSVVKTTRGCVTDHMTPAICSSYLPLETTVWRRAILSCDKLKSLAHVVHISMIEFIKLPVKGLFILSLVHFIFLPSFCLICHLCFLSIFYLQSLSVLSSFLQLFIYLLFILTSTLLFI